MLAINVHVGLYIMNNLLTAKKCRNDI